jgi:CheY-like chemotaxis protein
MPLLRGATLSPGNQQRLVLLVEDDRDTLEALSDVVERQGINVVAASDGVEALEVLRGGLRPDAVFLDNWMPKLDGDRVLHAMKSDPSLASIRIVWMSAGASPPPAGAEHLQKPIDTARLLAMLRAL